MDKEDGLPLEAEDFVLHVDVDDELLSAQDELSPFRHKEVAKEFVLLHDVEEFILPLCVDDDAEDEELLSSEGEDEILVVLGREESKSLPSSSVSTRRTNSPQRRGGGYTPFVLLVNLCSSSASTWRTKSLASRDGSPFLLRSGRVVEFVLLLRVDKG